MLQGFQTCSSCFSSNTLAYHCMEKGGGGGRKKVEEEEEETDIGQREHPSILLSLKGPVMTWK